MHKAISTKVQGKTCLWQYTKMSIKLFGFLTQKQVKIDKKKCKNIKNIYNNKTSGKIYRHKSMQVSRSTKPLTNHSWQVWRSIYNSHIDVKIFPTMIWVHKEQAALLNA